METNTVEKIISETRYMRIATAVVLGMLALYLLILSANEYRSGKFIGSGVTASNTITVSGEGEAYAIPDTATFSFTVAATANDAASAQKQVVEKAKQMIDYVKAQGVADIDIQTTDYSIAPHYVYDQGGCSGGYCPGNQKITGYDVAETVTIKVKDATKAGDILAGVGAKNPSNISGLTFMVDKPTQVQAQARDKAIADAKTKADELASQLHVVIVRVVGFSEDGVNTPRPMMYDKAVMSAGAEMQSASAPIEVGQNKYISNVSVTYEIR